MPYVNIQVTQEGEPPHHCVSSEQKAQLIQGVTQLLETVLNKDPVSTFVVIQEVHLDNWGIAGMPVTEYRKKNQSLNNE